jgi:hypothetical protein
LDTALDKSVALAAAGLDGRQGMERTTHRIAREVRQPPLKALSSQAGYPHPMHIPTSITGPVSDLAAWFDSGVARLDFRRLPDRPNETTGL